MNDRLFYLRATARFATRPILAHALHRSHRRLPETVRNEYDTERSAFLHQFRNSAWPVEDYIMREAGEHLYDKYYFANVLDGKLTRGCHHEIRVRLLSRLAAAISMYEPTSVLEVGAGTGRNLLWLKTQFPDLKAMGLELSMPSVVVAREAAERYRVDVSFDQANVVDRWPDVCADVIFSVHAVEYMNPAQAVTAMVARARKAVVMFEPLPDLWNGLPGLASRLRSRYLDGLPAGAFDGFRIAKAEMLPDGLALNRTSEIHIRADT